MHFHIQERSAVQFPADAALRCGKRSPYAVSLKAVVLKAAADQERNQKIGSSSEQLQEVDVHVDQMSSADFRDSSENSLGLFPNGSALLCGEGIDQVSDRRRPAVFSVSPVEPCELPGRKTVFISLPAQAPAPCIQRCFEQILLPCHRYIELIRVARGKSAGINYDAGAQTALHEGSEGMDSEVCRTHDIVAKHLTAVISYPHFVMVASAIHIADTAAHVEVVVGLLA